MGLRARGRLVRSETGQRRVFFLLLGNFARKLEPRKLRSRMGTFSGRRIKGPALCLTIIAVVMAHAQWIQTTRKELPSNSPWHQYRIEGKFLTRPRSPSSPPAFIVECQAGDRSPLSDRVGENFDRARITPRPA